MPGRLSDRSQCAVARIDHRATLTDRGAAEVMVLCIIRAMPAFRLATFYTIYVVGELLGVTLCAVLFFQERLSPPPRRPL